MELALSTSPLIASGAKFSEGGVGGGEGGRRFSTHISKCSKMEEREAWENKVEQAKRQSEL